MMKIKYFIGIDVSKAKLDAAWLKDTQTYRYRSKVLGNDPKGCLQLLDWIRKNITPNLAEVGVVMEATSVYHELSAYFLHDNGIQVSIINPARIAEFAKALGTVHKTDKNDSRVLARYGATVDFPLWQPEPLPLRQLKAKIARMDALQTDWQREENRLEKARIGSAPDEVILSIHRIKTAISDSMAELQRDIDEHIDRHPDLKRDVGLLKTIPGVGDAVAPRMALLYRSRSFRSAAQMAAFLGLVPKERTSGRYRGKVRLSKQGNSRLRALLYMPAVVAKRFNPDIKACCERLLARGKSPMQAIGAAMRRLVHICFGVLKHQTVYQARTVDF